MSKYVLPDQNITGSLELTIMGEKMSGIAVSLESPGHEVLCEVTAEVLGECKPYSLTGSLPLVKELQDDGFDLQIIGYGLMKTYHAKNEYGLLSDFEHGFQVCLSGRSSARPRALVGVWARRSVAGVAGVAGSSARCKEHAWGRAGVQAVSNDGWRVGARRCMPMRAWAVEQVGMCERMDA